jgi:hypothetical protein
MTPDEFRTHGHALIDWITDYLEHVEQHPVSSTVQPGDVRRQLPEHLCGNEQKIERLQDHRPVRRDTQRHATRVGHENTFL